MATGNGGKGNGRKKRPGPKTRCTKAVTKQFASIIGMGATSRAACNALRLNEATVAEWMTKGEQGKAPCYVAFRDAIVQARGVRQVKLNKVVFDSAKAGNTADARWYLSILDPDTYSQKQRLEHSGDPENPLTIRIIKVPQLGEDEQQDGSDGA